MKQQNIYPQIFEIGLPAPLGVHINQKDLKNVDK